MYETIYTVKVLSEEPIPDTLDLEDVLAEADTGDYVAIWESASREIDGPECAKLLYAYGSDPGFFGLADDGAPNPNL